MIVRVIVKEIIEEIIEEILGVIIRVIIKEILGVNNFFFEKGGLLFESGATYKIPPGGKLRVKLPQLERWYSSNNKKVFSSNNKKSFGNG